LAGVDNTLAASALMAGASVPVTTDADVDMLIGLAVADRPAAERDRIHIERLTTTRTAAMDTSLMRLALRNLLANALRHSAAAAPVSVRVTDSDEPMALVIDVIDHGGGIDPAVRQRLFERGARGPRTDERASHGLGLYIVRRVLETQSGQAELLWTGPRGTAIRLVLPQASAE
jgi:signal transduction histidine kinase